MHSQADSSALFSPQDGWLCAGNLSFCAGFHLLGVGAHVCLSAWLAASLPSCLVCWLVFMSVCVCLSISRMHACMHACTSSLPIATYVSCYAFECWRHGFILPALFSLQDRVRAFSKAGRQQLVGWLSGGWKLRQWYQLGLHLS